MRTNGIRLNRVNVITAQVRADLDVNQLARMSGLSRSTVIAVRSGKSVSRASAEKLVAVLGPEIIQQQDTATNI